MKEIEKIGVAVCVGIIIGVVFAKFYLLPKAEASFFNTNCRAYTQIRLKQVDPYIDKKSYFKKLGYVYSGH